MSSFKIFDNGDESDLNADNWKDAFKEAREFMKDGYTAEKSTEWYDYIITEYDDDGEEIRREDRTITIDPQEPDCEFEGETFKEHEWVSPHEIVGGLEENPGVHGHGGGVVFYEFCKHCGLQLKTDSWAQRPDNGQQGLHSVSYEEASNEILAWLKRKKNEVENKRATSYDATSIG